MDKDEILQRADKLLEQIWVTIPDAPIAPPAEFAPVAPPIDEQAKEAIYQNLVDVGVAPDTAKERAFAWAAIGARPELVWRLLHDGWSLDKVEIFLFTGLTTQQAHKWESAGFALESADFPSWFCVCNEADEAKAWRDAGFDSDDALLWSAALGSGISSISQALRYVQEGLAPHDIPLESAKHTEGEG